MAVIDKARLDAIPFLSRLCTEERAQLESLCRWRRYGDNEQILDQMSLGGDVFFIVSGRVQIVNFALSGREVAFAELNTGGYFGELSAIDGAPRSASAVAKDDCVVGVLSAKHFNDLLNAHPELMALLLKRLAQMIRRNNERVMDLSTQSATHRVYRELIKIASENRPTSGVTDDWSISPMPTQKIIAARTSTTRETVARTMIPSFKVV